MQKGAPMQGWGDGSGITNGAGNNVVPKSNGTNLVASSLSDDGTEVSSTKEIHINLGAAGDALTSTGIGGSGFVINCDSNGNWTLGSNVQDKNLIIRAGTSGGGPIYLYPRNTDAYLVETTHFSPRAAGKITGHIETNRWGYVGTNALYVGRVAKTATYTATTSDYFISGDATGGAFSITLPAASGNSGLILIIKKIDSSGNAVTIDGNASETIDGAATVALSTQYAFRAIICDGTNWFTIGGTAL